MQHKIVGSEVLLSGLSLHSKACDTISFVALPLTAA